MYHAEQTHSYTVLTDLVAETVTDDASPAGVQKRYRGILPDSISGESCLCFVIPHHHIQVYFDTTLMYSLTAAENNPFGRNVGNNWCSIHVAPQYAGSAITVVLTPLFEAAADKEPTFLFGSHYAIAADVLTGELPLLVLSVLCILLGLFVILVNMYFRCIVRVEASETNYLGLFSIELGLWRLTDMDSLALLLPNHTAVINYISVGSLFLGAVCLMTYFGTLFAPQYRLPSRVLSTVGSAVSLLVLAAQVLGQSEFRQNLVYSHLLLLAAISSIALIALYNRVTHKHTGLQRSWSLLLLLPVGIGLELLFYYLNGANSLLSFTILSFILYTLIIFLNSVQETSRRAYTDARTGLVNRSRWNDLMHSSAPLEEPYGILMIDLNGLKRVNDTLGHEAGDQMIFQFSNILQNTLPRSSVICRWGGDEFTVLLTGISREQLTQQTQLLHDAVEKYNTENPRLPIHFAFGAALSTEHPSLSRSALFHLADEEMYRNKQMWYAGQ